SRGSREPSTVATGWANVSVSVVSGRSRPPEAGSDTTLVRAPGTNHETWTGSDSFSHGRTAAATVVVPVVALPDATTPSETMLDARSRFRGLGRPIATR